MMELVVLDLIAWVLVILVIHSILPLVCPLQSVRPEHSPPERITWFYKQIISVISLRTISNTMVKLRIMMIQLWLKCLKNLQVVSFLPISIFGMVTLKWNLRHHIMQVLSLLQFYSLKWKMKSISNGSVVNWIPQKLTFIMKVSWIIIMVIRVPLLTLMKISMSMKSTGLKMKSIG